MTSKAGWGLLRQPLQIESLRRRLPDSPQTDQLLRRLQRYRENLDAVIYALASRELAEDRRRHLVEILQRHRVALDDCLTDLGIRPPRPQHPPPLWHFNQLDAVARGHLAAILGVPEEPAFFDVLDLKAEEYLAQLHAFGAITEADGFRERESLPRGSRRGALVLTLSGSLIQLSVPDSSGARRYLYQNIYGNAHPPEGVLVLDRDIAVGHRVRSVELTTSPARLLRVAGRRMSWSAQSRTFARLSRTLSSLGAPAAGVPGVDVTGVIGKGRHPRDNRFNPQAAERVLHLEYGESFERFVRLRQAFDAGRGDERTEAELLTICHYLQTGARELGFDARALEDLEQFVTVDHDRYAVDAGRQQIVRLPEDGTPEVVYAHVSVGRQLVTCRAPLALIGAEGALLEVISPIARLRRK